MIFFLFMLLHVYIMNVIFLSMGTMLYTMFACNKERQILLTCFNRICSIRFKGTRAGHGVFEYVQYTALKVELGLGVCAHLVL